MGSRIFIRPIVCLSNFGSSVTNCMHYFLLLCIIWKSLICSTITQYTVTIFILHCPRQKILSSLKYIIVRFQVEVHSFSVLTDHFYGRRKGLSVKSVLWKHLLSFEKFSLCPSDKIIVSFCMNVPLRGKVGNSDCLKRKFSVTDSRKSVNMDNVVWLTSKQQKIRNYF